MDIPLALRAADYNSSQSKGQLVNMIAETNKAADYITVKRVEGLESFTTTPGNLPCRSNLHRNGDYIYFVSGAVFYRFNPDAVSPTPVSLGTIGGSGRATVVSNSVPGDNQILVLNGTGAGYIYQTATLTQITDVDFYPTTSVAILNERFWFPRDGTNEYFCSDIADGFSYDPLAFATAEWKPDNARITVSKKSALWVLGSSTAEYNQSFDDIIFPLRPVRGASLDVGILANNSFAELDDYFCFLGDNSNIYLIAGTEAKIISDLEFDIKIRGDGTLQNPGFTADQIADCIGFFIDTPQHKVYYLSFPTANYTWGYDLVTGLTHTRQSANSTAWRGVYAITDQNNIYMGDNIDGTIWLLKAAAKSEGDGLLSATMRTPSVRFPVDCTLPIITVGMEVGVGESPGSDPQMIVRVSKNGGKTWKVHSHQYIGGWGEYNKRVIMRNFGRVVRYDDFQLEFVVTDAVRVQFYDIVAGEELDGY